MAQMLRTTSMFRRSLCAPTLYERPGTPRSNAVASASAWSSTYNQSRTLDPVPYTGID